MPLAWNQAPCIMYINEYALRYCRGGRNSHLYRFWNGSVDVSAKHKPVDAPQRAMQRLSQLVFRRQRGANCSAEYSTNLHLIQYAEEVSRRVLNGEQCKTLSTSPHQPILFAAINFCHSFQVALQVVPISKCLRKSHPKLNVGPDATGSRKDGLRYIGFLNAWTDKLMSK